jgi:hypothetical protein
LSIPTAIDYDLAEIDSMASNIMNLLRTMQRAAKKDVPGMRKRLREMLEAYAVAVMATAPK